MSTQALDATMAAAPAAAPDQSDADILAIAEAADAGKPLATAPPSAAPETKPSTPAASGESVKPGEGKDGKPAAPAAEAKPGEKPADPKPADGKPESAFDKARKESERRDRSWKALDEEKNRVREREQIAEKAIARVAQLEQQVATLTAAKPAAPAGPAKDEHGFTADTYDRLAKDYEDKGDDQMAKLAKSKAEKLRAAPPAAPAPTAAPAASGEAWKTPEFQQQWGAEAAAIVKENPEIGKPDNPVFQAVQKLVNEPETARFFRAHPAGLRAAVQVAQLQQSAARVPELEKQLGEKDAEIKRLNGLLQPKGGLPAAPAPGAKSIDDMTDSEREAHVLAAAAAADRGGT